MEKYNKETSRLVVKFVDGDTDDLLFEIRDRNWMNIGELFTNHVVSSIMEQEMKGRKKPENILVLAVGEYTKE